MIMRPLFLLLAGLPFISQAAELPPVEIWATGDAKKLSEYRYRAIDKKSFETRENPTVAGIESVKTILHSGKDAHVDAYLWSRALSESKDYKGFMALLKSWGEKLSAETGQKDPKNILNDRRSAVRSSGAVWQGEDMTYHLEWSINDKREPEFAILHVYPGRQMDKILKDAATQLNLTVAKYDPKEHLETKPDGTVWIKDVPMITQTGGYCVVASIARVGLLYGTSVDQNALAEACKSDPAKGTSANNVYPFLKANASKLRMRLKDPVHFGSDKAEAALRAGAIQLRRTVDFKRFSPDLDIREQLGSDRDAYAIGRAKDKSELNRFKNRIHETIDRGHPLCWEVVLGLVKEPLLTPQTAGGHVRLIIGYNKARDTIIFSDSWGPDHAAKEIPLTDAFIETRGYFTLTPM